MTTSGGRKRLSKGRRVELAFLEGIRRRCPDNPRVLKPLGDLYTKVGRVQEGLDVDRRLTRLCPEESEVWYNLGCSYALAGLSKEAFEALGQAVELGYDDPKWMREDKDLLSLHDDPRFAALLVRAGFDPEQD